MAIAPAVPVWNPQCSCSCQDILHPFVADKRLPEDTLFWILEEDFRFWPPGQDPDLADDYEEEYFTLLVDRTADPPSHQASKGKGKDKSGAYRPERLRTAYHEALARGNSNEDDPNHGFSQDVCDMMRIATMCHRAGWGDFIWASWCPVKAKPSRIGHGSQCLLLTKFGFNAIKSATDRNLLKRGHIDLMLQDWLRNPGEAERARACYLYPPIGSYTEHASECDPAQFGGDKTRQSGFFSRENPCHGTRKAGDPKSREKYMYQWRGFDWTARACTQFPSEAVLHSEQFVWRSCEEPTAFDDSLPSPDTQAHKGKDKGEGKGTEWGSNPGKTHRQKRAYRSFLTKMAKRYWVTPWEQPLCV